MREALSTANNSVIPLAASPHTYLKYISFINYDTIKFGILSIDTKEI